MLRSSKALAVDVTLAQTPETLSVADRVALLCDYYEEGWTSMDQVAKMLATAIPGVSDHEVDPIRPAYRHIPGSGNIHQVRSLERFLNRFWVYPSYINSLPARKLYHIADHSYAHLASSVPAGRAIVHCHDIDCFRCLTKPASDVRPWWFRAMSAKLLQGIRAAAHVICVSEVTRSELVRHAIVEYSRTSVVHNGIDSTFFALPDKAAYEHARRILSPHEASPYMINVGSTIPRKRVDLLLHIFAHARQTDPDLRLVRVGIPLTTSQQDLAERLRVRQHMTELVNVPTPVLAALYRNAAGAVQPTAAEGFGLPLAEALACGCPVIATDLPVLREVAGDCATYVSSADPQRWADAWTGLCQIPASPRQRQAAAQRASMFSWQTAARRIGEIYDECLQSVSVANFAAPERQSSRAQ